MSMGGAVQRKAASLAQGAWLAPRGHGELRVEAAMFRFACTKRQVPRSGPRRVAALTR